MEPKDQTPAIDDLVDHLLRDQDILLASEIRHRVEDLNRMLAQAQRQNLRVEAKATTFSAADGDPVAYIDVRIFREI